MHSVGLIGSELGSLALGYKIQNSKKKIRHLHGDLNLDEIKNTLRLLSVNSETNLMSLINPSLEVVIVALL